MTQLFTIHEIHSKLCHTTLANTHHDVITFKVDCMFKMQNLNISRMEHDFSMK